MYLITPRSHCEHSDFLMSTCLPVHEFSHEDTWTLPHQVSVAYGRAKKCSSIFIFFSSQTGIFCNYIKFCSIVKEKWCFDAKV